MKSTVHIAARHHEVAYEELNDLLKRHAAQLSPVEILAIAANVVGKLIAFQDQRTMTVDLAMKIVGKNIEIGNAQAQRELMQTVGSA